MILGGEEMIQKKQLYFVAFVFTWLGYVLNDFLRDLF